MLRHSLSNLDLIFSSSSLAMFSKVFLKNVVASFAVLAAAADVFFLDDAFAQFFSPTQFKVTFYKMGLENSSTGERWAIFDNSNGQEVDFSQPNSISSLATGVVAVSGTWDRIFAITSNSQTVSGSTTSNSCFVKAGSYTKSQFGEYRAATAISGLAGVATIIEDTFSATAGVIDVSPVDTLVSSEFNGDQVSDLKVALVSSSNPVVGGGGTINRRLFFGTLPQPINTSTKKDGTIWITVDPTNRFEDSCSTYTEDGIKFNLSVQ